MVPGRVGSYFWHNWETPWKKPNKQSIAIYVYIYLCITEPQNKRCKRKLILNACILWDAFRFQSLCKVKIDTAPPLEIYQSTNPAGHCYWEGDAPTAYYWANCNTFLVLNVNEKDSWEIPLRKPPFWSDLGWGCYYLLRYHQIAPESRERPYRRFHLPNIFTAFAVSFRECNIKTQTVRYWREIPQIDHAFALFDPPKLGNPMIPVI